MSPSTRPRPHFERVTRRRRRPSPRAQLELVLDRPRVRGDCARVPRPCMWLACVHNLALDFLPPTDSSPLGTIKLNFATPSEMGAGSSCALDVADRGETTLEEIARFMNLSDERVRQIDLEARAKVRLAILADSQRREAAELDERPAAVMTAPSKGAWKPGDCCICGRKEIGRTPDGKFATRCSECAALHAKEMLMAAKKSKKDTKTAETERPKWSGTGAMPKGAVERSRFTEKLPCRIEDVEVAVKASELAVVIRERETVLEEKREANAAFRASLNHFDEQLKELATAVEQHTEMREVECVRYLLPNNEVQTVRVDTGEVIATGTADAVDLQEPLPAAKKSEPENDPADDEDFEEVDTGKIDTGLPIPKSSFKGAHEGRPNDGR